MRIAVLTNSYPPDARGGSGQIAKMQIEWLRAHNHEVRVFLPAPFTGSSTPHIFAFKPQTSVPFARLAKHNILSRLIFHYEDLAPNTELVEAVRSYKPDVLLTHNLTGCGWGTPKILRQAGIRQIHILHDVQMVEPSGQIMAGESFTALRRLWRNYWSAKRSKTFGEPDILVSPSKWLLNYHQSYGLFQSAKSLVIPNPIQQRTKTDNSESIKTNHVQSTTYEVQSKILYVGRVSKDKGVETLIKAWKLFQQKLATESVRDANADQAPFKGIHLVIVGDGPYLKNIQDLKDPGIECVGQVDHSKIEHFYQSSSLFVFPSLLQENQPTVILEAVSAGLNIVASDIGGVGETLQGYGTLVPPGDFQKLAEAILEQLSQPPDEAKAQEILKTHQIDTVMKKLSEALAE